MPSSREDADEADGDIITASVRPSCGQSASSSALGGEWASGHENGRASSRLARRAGDVRFSDEGQFPQSLAKLLFARHRATQPQLRGRGGTLRTKAMYGSVEGLPRPLLN